MGKENLTEPGLEPKLSEKVPTPIYVFLSFILAFKFFTTRNLSVDNTRKTETDSLKAKDSKCVVMVT